MAGSGSQSRRAVHAEAVTSLSRIELMVISCNDTVTGGFAMNEAIDTQQNKRLSIGEMYKKFRRDTVINDVDWLAPYSTEEIVDAIDDIALGELGKKVITNAARMAWGERKIPFGDWERFTPDQLQEKLERDFLKSYDIFQDAKLRRAQIERLEAMTGRANTIPFPKRERLPRAKLKKVDTA